jgi:hypothetical protein
VKYLLRLGWSRCQDGVRLVFDTVPDSSSQVPSQKNDWSLDSAEWKSRRWCPVFTRKSGTNTACSFDLELDELRSCYVTLHQTDL